MAGSTINAAHALDGLELYSHVWLIWLAHLNGRDAARSRVQPPSLRGKKTGLFATRTPYRPNPVGLTLCRLEAIDGDELHLSGVDLVDGTPILDIKPYLPQSDTPVGEVRRAPWAESASRLGVAFSSEALEQLRGLPPTRSLSDVQDWESLLRECLASDPRPVYKWRRSQREGSSEADRSYETELDGVRVRYHFVSDDAVVVDSVHPR